MARAVREVRFARVEREVMALETSSQAGTYSADKLRFLERRMMSGNPLAHETTRGMMAAFEQWEPTGSGGLYLGGSPSWGIQTKGPLHAPGTLLSGSPSKVPPPVRSARKATAFGPGGCSSIRKPTS